MEKKFLTSAESWSYLGISKGLFYKLKKQKQLRTFSVGGSKKNLYSLEDVLSLVTERILAR